MKRFKENVIDKDGEVSYYSNLIANGVDKSEWGYKMASVLLWSDIGGAVSNHNMGLAFELAKEVLDEA